MIQCPSCGKDIADDSVHCGFCGAKIEMGAGKKTMIGFAAVSGDVLKQAAEEARKAREAEAAAPKKITLPTPNVPAAEPPASESPSSGLRIPAPPGTAPADENAPTSAHASIGAPSTLAEPAVPAPPHDTDPIAFAPAAEPPMVAEETLPEVDTPTLAGPTELGGGAPTSGPTEFGGPVQAARPTLPAKKKNPAVILIAVVGVILFFCCVAGLAWSIFPAIVGAM